jgi:hypothetical protein
LKLPELSTMTVIGSQFRLSLHEAFFDERYPRSAMFRAEGRSSNTVSMVDHSTD